MKKEIRIIGLSFIGLLLTAQVQRVHALPAPVASLYAMSLAEASSEVIFLLPETVEISMNFGWRPYGS